MRRLALTVTTLLGLSASAFAADMPDNVLRGSESWVPNFVPGSPVYYRWEGIYGGVQGSYSTMNANFKEGTSDLVAYILRNTTLENEAHVSQWTTLPKAGTHGTSWGLFAGYNMQFGDAVIGVEANYNAADATAAASDSLSRSYQTTDGYFYNTTVSARSSVHLTDVGSLRVRGGWSANWFMPYITLGLAVARGDTDRSATVTTSAVDVTAQGRPNLGLGPITQSDIKNGFVSFGYALGAGVDVALTQNIFLRGEYEYMRFGDFRNAVVNLNNFRVGAGLKF
jgi:opacity protein-like surface antigen